MLNKIRQKNAVGEGDSSSQILIKYAGNSHTIKLKILAVLFLEFLLIGRMGITTTLL